MAKHKIKKQLDDEITVIIPAAGRGRRMKSYGPKPLINIGRSTIIQRQVDMVKSIFPNAKFVVVAGFEADKVINNVPQEFIKLENELYEETNVCRSVSIALNAVSAERVLILMGDLVFNKEALSTLDFQRSCISANLDEHRGGEVGCVVSPDNTISNMMYDLDLKWNQIIYLQSKELDIFKSICTKRKYRKLFLFEIINKVIDRGGKIKCITNDNVKVIDVDNSKDLLRIKDIL
jgi:choline kinase